MDIFRKDADIDNIKDRFGELVLIIDRLRNSGGCPWDRKQKIDDVKEFLIEEAYELIEAISCRDYEAISEELGDLLLIGLFLARICEEEGEFDISDSLRVVIEKLIRRHPHVFAGEDITDAEEVVKRWTQIKNQEKKRDSVWQSVPSHGPALFQYYIFLKEYKKHNNSNAYHDSEKDIDREKEKRSIVESLSKMEESTDKEKRRMLTEAFVSLIRICKLNKINPELLLLDYLVERRKSGVKS